MQITRQKVRNKEKEKKTMIDEVVLFVMLLGLATGSLMLILAYINYREAKDYEKQIKEYKKKMGRD